MNSTLSTMVQHSETYHTLNLKADLNKIITTYTTVWYIASSDGLHPPNKNLNIIICLTVKCT